MVLVRRLSPIFFFGSLCGLCLCDELHGGEAAVPPVARAIAAEASLPNGAPMGRPLPLAAHWNTGQYPRAAGFDPAWQMQTIGQGHYLLPWFQLNAPSWGQMTETYYEAPMRRAAELRLPITLVSTQWESELTADPGVLNAPADANPHVLGLDGTFRKAVSPFGPLGPWRQVGRRWTSLPIVRRLQEWYPDPPRVVFLSNNEHSKLTWKQVETSRRYLERYGKGRDDEFKRRVVAEGWIERYRALQAGMREGLTSPAWRRAAVFVAYDAFGPPHLGRWGGWMDYSLVTSERIDPWPLAFDGASPSYYVHNWDPSTDYTVWSPQVESMNWPFMLDEAFRLNPGFWWEVSVWDGHEPARDDDMRKVYARRGQAFTPERYRGFVQFGMWLLRPRVVREFRGWTGRRDEMWPYFKEVVAAVDRVHADATLAAFWRQGDLVPNRARPHPYRQGVPQRWRDVDRWFLLDTDLMPKEPWNLDTAIPVFALALVRGRAPERRWLVYAHAPLSPREGVRITLPGYGAVTGAVAVGGTFFVVDEKSREVTPVLG